MNWLHDLKIFMITALVGIAAMLPVYQSEKEMHLSSELPSESQIELSSEAEVTDKELNEIIALMESNTQKLMASEDAEFYKELVNDDELNEKNMGRITLVSSETPLIELQDPKSCKASQLVAEKSFNKNSKLMANLNTDRNDSAQINKLPKECVAHIMNSFQLPSTAFAKCSSGNAKPQRNGSKPCITETMVNVTYNSLFDVADCLNLDPKVLLPKLYNEGGLLINTYGGGSDAGVGQLTEIAIEETNKFYKGYLKEINDAKISKPSCFRLIENKKLIEKTVNPNVENRCSLIAAPENPLKNILYMGILNRKNQQYFSGIKYYQGLDYFVDELDSYTSVKYDDSDSFHGKFKTSNIKEKLFQLGLKDANLHDFMSMLTLASYNAGYTKVFDIFNDYLDQRIASGGQLTWKDFDFFDSELVLDPVTKEMRTAVSIAKSFVYAPIVNKSTTQKDKTIKAKRVKALAGKIKASKLLSFPEYLIYRQNNYFDSVFYKKSSAYRLNGSPGYLNALASRDTEMRNVFSQSSYGPDYCSNPKFLMRYKNP